MLKGKKKDFRTSYFSTQLNAMVTDVNKHVILIDVPMEIVRMLMVLTLSNLSRCLTEQKNVIY